MAHYSKPDVYVRPILWLADRAEGKANRQTLVVDTTNNNQSFTGPGYIAAKQAAALQGQTYNPTLGFEPVKSAGRNVFQY